MTATKKYELVGTNWLGTPDSCAPERYSIFPYLDLAWHDLGNTGDCPESFESEEIARAVAGKIREDKYGVMPRMTVREKRD